MRRQLKVERLGLADRVRELRAAGKSYQQIVEILNPEVSENLNVMDIKRWLDKHSEEIGDYLRHHPETRAKVEKEILNSVAQLRMLNDKLWKFVNELEKEGDLSATRISAMREIREQLEFQNKLLGKISPTQIRKQVNILQMNLRVDQVIKILEAKGYKIVKVKKKEEVKKA